MAPVITSKIHWLHIPIDAGKTWRGKRIFGDHKTVRGFLVGILFAVIIALIQWQLAQKNIIPFPYFSDVRTFLLYGFLSGFGALAGDAIESFVKRQIGITSGNPFVPFDQIDYIVGFLLSTSFLIHWDIPSIILLLTAGLILNPLTNFIAYALKIKNTYW
ncbi:CDP-archaeol synthase [Candidatus Gracilibacteria bacterium]|nr:CDP-archaeol synthase [Candidatus Gracilibacteria bacterium]